MRRIAHGGAWVLALLSVVVVEGCREANPDFNGFGEATDGDGSCEDPAQTSCDGVCVDPSSDLDHCGGCDQPCFNSDFCVDGVCGSECEQPNQICSDLCVDTDYASDHCGDCGNSCPDPKTCVMGKCELVCDPDETQCDCPPGHEWCGGECLDARSDELNCGGCGQACAATQTCDHGECECHGTQTLCVDGCFDTNNDEDHCGDCETACNGGEQCDQGECNDD